jgi:ubiquinone/menaquinone biosynthesis C-methylase UbiE
VPVFRKSVPHALSVAMTGVRLGDRLLQIGCSNPSLLGAVSSKVGLSGRACVVVSDEAASARAARGAAQAGVLIEVTQAAVDRCPFDEESFDVVVVDSTDGRLGALGGTGRHACLSDARRVLAPRGRIVVIDAGTPVGLSRFLRPTPPIDHTYQASGGPSGALEAAGFRAVRTLAERDGLIFVEGTK